MEFGLLDDDDTTRYCFLRLGKLKKAIADDKILTGLLEQLDVPGKPATLKGLSPREKLKAIEHQIKSFQSSSTSIWRGVDGPEVLAGSLFRAQHGCLPTGLVKSLFSAVKREEDLVQPVAKWLKSKGHEAYVEVPMGPNRMDVVGYKPPALMGLFSENFIAVELKNELNQFKRGLDQLATARDYSNQAYIACTPHFAASYLDKHAQAKDVRHWDAGAFRRRIADFGFGLLVVEDDRVFEIVGPKSTTVHGRKREELQSSMRKARRAVA